jgi:hypothetical protein
MEKETVPVAYAVPNNVLLMRCLESQLDGHPLIESDSYKTSGFSGRKLCFKKRLGISDEYGCFVRLRGNA